MIDGGLEPLHREHSDYIVTYIARLVPDAASDRNPMRQFARNAISDALWRWTADGYNPETRVVEKDLFKYDFFRKPYTAAAQTMRDANLAANKDATAGLRHEHSVPRKWLVDKILSLPPDPATLHDILSRLCKAVIVTKGDDALLTLAKLRSTMPPGWDEADPYARYRHPRVNLFDSITWPEDR